MNKLKNFTFNSDKIKKVLTVTTLIILLAMMSVVSAGAIDIATPITTAINDIISNIKSIVAAILSLITVVLIAALIFKIATVYHQYREGSEINYAPFVFLIAGLIISATASTWMWTMV